MSACFCRSYSRQSVVTNPRPLWIPAFACPPSCTNDSRSDFTDTAGGIHELVEHDEQQGSRLDSCRRCHKTENEVRRAQKVERHFPGFTRPKCTCVSVALSILRLQKSTQDLDCWRASGCSSTMGQLDCYAGQQAVGARRGKVYHRRNMHVLS